MNLSSFFFLVREGFRNIRRNGLMSLAALGTVTVALTVLGSSLWTAYRINEIAQAQPRTLNEIDAFIPGERSASTAVLARVQALPNVASVKLVTREQAWQEMQQSDPTMGQALDTNPLPDKLAIETRDPAEMGALVARLRDHSQFAEIAEVKSTSDEVRIMLAAARIIKIVGGMAALGLFLATFFIVHNTIRLTVFARRREIRTMQLVGATPGFIRFPLLLEGVFHGVVGALIAGAIVLFCRAQVGVFVSRFHSVLLGDVPARLGPVELIGGMVAIGVLVSLIGSHMAMHRFLRQV